MSIKGTRLYRKMIAAIKSRYPDDTLLLPAKVFRTSAMWMYGREDVIREADLFILIGDLHGWIGRGGMLDLEYFKRLERPILFMTPDGTLHTTFSLRERTQNDSWQYAYETRIQGYYGDPRPICFM
jgi:hypothetical protein